MQTRRTTSKTGRAAAKPAAARPRPKANTTTSAAPLAPLPPAPPPASRRTLYVMVSLVGVMSLTSVLLMLVRTDPLVPDTSRSLLAVDSPEAADRVFDTPAPVVAGRWHSIYVHHSRTPGGNADTLAESSAGSAADGGLPDHFVIGNGDGCPDGAVQVGRRWEQQRPAGRPPGVDRMRPDCVSVCLIGDLDRADPTPAQLQRLNQLVAALQRRLQITADRVWLVDAPASPAGVGRHFPKADFRDRLRP